MAGERGGAHDHDLALGDRGRCGGQWTTEDVADLDACEAFLVDELAQHIKAFDSYPGIQLAQGNYALSQVWNLPAEPGRPPESVVRILPGNSFLIVQI